MKQQINGISHCKASSSAAVLAIALCFVLGALLLQPGSAMSLDQAMDASGKTPTVTLAVIENPEVVARVLDGLLRSILYSPNLDYQATQT